MITSNSLASIDEWEPYSKEKSDVIHSLRLDEAFSIWDPFLAQSPIGKLLLNVYKFVGGRAEGRFSSDNSSTIEVNEENVFSVLVTSKTLLCTQLSVTLSSYERSNSDVFLVVLGALFTLFVKLYASCLICLHYSLWPLGLHWIWGDSIGFVLLDLESRERF